MNIDFSNIQDYVILMDDFSLKWRFTEEEYNVLPKQDLIQLKPFDVGASKFLSDFIGKSNLHCDIPFTKSFFKAVKEIDNLDGNEDEVTSWLLETGIAPDKYVFLSYREDTAMVVPWNLLIKYYDDFQYSDDLTVFDHTLNWALLFFHEGRIYFGTNET